MRERSAEIEIRFFAGNSEFFGIECLPENLRAVEHGFRRYAASVQAHSAELVFSMSAVFSPLFAAVIAALYPAGPPPITARSKISIGAPFAFFNYIRNLPCGQSNALFFVDFEGCKH